MGTRSPAAGRGSQGSSIADSCCQESTTASTPASKSAAERSARSAVAAGIPTVGNLVFVPETERAERAAALADAGVLAVVGSWQELTDLLLPALARRATGDLLPTGGAQ